MEGDQLDGLAKGDGGKDGKKWMGWRKKYKEPKVTRKAQITIRYIFSSIRLAKFFKY